MRTNHEHHRPKNRKKQISLANTLWSIMSFNNSPKSRPIPAPKDKMEASKVNWEEHLSVASREQDITARINSYTWDELNLLWKPCIQGYRANLRNVNSKAAMDPWALDAHKNTQVHTCPPWSFASAICTLPVFR
jgi:hypothetical protein